MVTIHAGGLLRARVNVEADDEAGGYAIARHMLGLGYRRILCAGGPMNVKGADRRVDGFLRAHADAGAEVASDHVIRTLFTAEGGRQAMQQWLQRHRGQPLPEAVCCGIDAIAIGCIDTLEGRGLSVPRDISITGFDDTLLAGPLHMTTVRQPLLEMGRRAVEVLMQLIEAQRREETYQGPRDIVLPVEIVHRRTLPGRRSGTADHPLVRGEVARLFP